MNLKLSFCREINIKKSLKSVDRKKPLFDVKWARTGHALYFCPVKYRITDIIDEIQIYVTTLFVS